MELKNFSDFIVEAKDTQKSKVNDDLHNKDATHGDKPEVLDTKVKSDGNNYEGDKPDILDTSINEADSQKEKENSDLKAKDASHGEKAQVIKEDGEDDEDDEKVIYGEKDDEDDEKELKESFGPTERAIISDNQGKKGGDHVIIKGKEDSSSYILSVHAKGITYMRTGGGQVILYSLDSSGKNVIYLDDSDVSIIYKNS